MIKLKESIVSPDRQYWNVTQDELGDNLVPREVWAQAMVDSGLLSRYNPHHPSIGPGDEITVKQVHDRIKYLEGKFHTKTAPLRPAESCGEETPCGFRKHGDARHSLKHIERLARLMGKWCTRTKPQFTTPVVSRPQDLVDAVKHLADEEFHTWTLRGAGISSPPPGPPLPVLPAGPDIDPACRAWAELLEAEANAILDPITDPDEDYDPQSTLDESILRLVLAAGKIRGECQ